ncbi:nuclear pore complex protein Nup205-like [Carassius gibelio]|uniref:nuclear pore complex protein Nup205-like n=1 Tax=Carassius gibelio TaxID=101364 RepID=UPI0022782C25|nr:nuclear pore complex protein Nup205-like [Carassius gibelio]
MHYRHPPTRGITQRELEGLTTFLQLLTTIITWVELSCEEYPLTRAFCHLISTQVESALPVNLGAGLRAPGFQPYLD